jgi:SNF2 family DNA or RNA helicase
MSLSNLGFFQRVKTGLVSKLSPLRPAEVVKLDIADLGLREATVTGNFFLYCNTPQITSDFCLSAAETAEFNTAPSFPEVSSDLCLAISELETFDLQPSYSNVISCQNAICQFETALSQKPIEDFTAWINNGLSSPTIKSFSMLMDQPGKAGKSYDSDAKKERNFQTAPKTQHEKCIHGMIKSWCSICNRQPKKEKQAPLPDFNSFDFILPILQPPLGENFDSPVAFPSDLYPFQRSGVKFLAEKERALLADEMGLGKSIQTIVTLKLLFRRGDIANGIILCPKSLLTDWEKKLKDWAPEIRVLKVRGNKDQRKISWDSPAHIYLTTYETLRQDLGNADSKDIAKKEFDIAILDEIQKIKNPSAEVTKSARSLVAARKWGLSGTPLENRTEELISIFAFLKPGLLRYEDAYQPSKIKESIKPFFLRRRKADVLQDLPEKNCDEVWLELSDAQRRAYDLAEQQGIVALNAQGDSVTVHNVLALITKLKQICNIEPTTGQSCKLEYLIDQLEEIKDQDDKALIFSQYSHKTLDLLEPKLRQFRPRLYDGSLSDSNRDRIIDEFQNKDDCKILLMSVKAGGLGLTLTRANFVFHFDLWWNPSVAEQAEARAHRIGQQKTVYVTSLFTINTIEEKIQTLLKRKRELFDRVIDDLSDTNLSVTLGEDELFGLFNLQSPKQKRYMN